MIPNLYRIIPTWNRARRRPGLDIVLYDPTEDAQTLHVHQFLPRT